MYEFVHAAPETCATPSRVAYTAARAGYDAVILRNHSDADEAEVPDETHVPVYEGVEVRANNVEGLHEEVRRYEDADIVAVHGGDEAINRAAIDAGVDLIAHPSRGRGRSFDHVLARKAADEGVAVELSLASVLRSSGGERVGAIRDIHELLMLSRKYGTPFVVSADPRDHLELRAPRELRAVARLVGVEDDEFGRATTETPERILADNDAPVEVVE